LKNHYSQCPTFPPPPRPSLPLTFPSDPRLAFMFTFLSPQFFLPRTHFLPIKDTFFSPCLSRGPPLRSRFNLSRLSLRMETFGSPSLLSIRFVHSFFPAFQPPRSVEGRNFSSFLDTPPQFWCGRFSSLKGNFLPPSRSSVNSSSMVLQKLSPLSLLVLFRPQKASLILPGGFWRFFPLRFL